MLDVRAMYDQQDEKNHIPHLNADKGIEFKIILMNSAINRVTVISKKNYNIHLYIYHIYIYKLIT